MYYDLLHFDVAAVDEAEEVNACSPVDADLCVAVDGLAAEHAAHHVDDLQGGLAFAAHHPLAAVVVGEVAGL